MYGQCILGPVSVASTFSLVLQGMCQGQFTHDHLSTALQVDAGSGGGNRAQDNIAFTVLEGINCFLPFSLCHTTNQNRDLLSLNTLLHRVLNLLVVNHDNQGLFDAVGEFNDCADLLPPRLCAGGGDVRVDICRLKVV